MGHPMTGHGTFEKTVRVGALRSLAWDWEIQDDSSDLNQEIGQRKHRFFGHSKRTHCFGTHPGRTARLLVPDAPGQGWCKVKVVNWNWMSDSYRFDALQGTTGSQSYWFKVLASSWECPDRHCLALCIRHRGWGSPAVRSQCRLHRPRATATYLRSHCKDYSGASNNVRHVVLKQPISFGITWGMCELSWVWLQYVSIPVSSCDFTWKIREGSLWSLTLHCRTVCRW